MPRFLSVNAKILKKLLLLVVALSFVGTRYLLPTPINNYHDMAIMHTVLGTDKFYTKKDKKQLRFYLSPFYQHTNHARNGHGSKCPTGDRLGQWNMSGLLFGSAAGGDPAVAGSKSHTLNGLLINGAGDETHAFHTAVAPVITGINTAGAVVVLTDDNNANTGLVALPVYQYLGSETNFNPDANTASTFSAVHIKHEKMGLRGQLTSDFAFGLGLSIKGGFVEYKEKPTFELSHRFRVNVGLDSPPKVLADDTDYIDPNLGAAVAENALKIRELQAIKGLYRNLLSPEAREKLFRAINLDVNSVHDTGMEDTHVQLFWHIPFDMKEEQEHTVTLVPYVAAGIWLPTGKIKNPDKAFSLDTGNSGCYGLTFEASLGFDFPKMVQFNVGGGAVVSLPKNFVARVPSCTEAVGVIKQSGFYPWKATIQKTPGLTWYANASIKADSYNGVMSLFLDYIYTYHEKDTIALADGALAGPQTTAFSKGSDRLMEESSWRSQLFNIGLDYRVTKNLSFGGAVQAPINGMRVFKPTTILGSMTLLF